MVAAVHLPAWFSGGGGGLDWRRRWWQVIAAAVAVASGDGGGGGYYRHRRWRRLHSGRGRRCHRRRRDLPRKAITVRPGYYAPDGYYDDGYVEEGVVAVGCTAAVMTFPIARSDDRSCDRVRNETTTAAVTVIAATAATAIDTATAAAKSRAGRTAAANDAATATDYRAAGHRRHHLRRGRHGALPAPGGPGRNLHSAAPSTRQTRWLRRYSKPSDCSLSAPFTGYGPTISGGGRSRARARCVRNAQSVRWELYAE